MQYTDKKVMIIIIAEKNDEDNIEVSVNNLKQNDCKEADYIVATVNSETSNIAKFCKDRNIAYHECPNIEYIYYELPKLLEFDYISFINAGDRYSDDFKRQLQSKKENIFVCPIIYNGNCYTLNKNILKKPYVDIEKEPGKIWLHFNSVFVSKSILKKVDKPNADNLEYYIDKNLLVKLITLNGGYEVLQNIELITTKALENSPESKAEEYELSWYKNVFSNIENLSQFCKNKYEMILEYQQYNYIYMIKNIINENVNMKNKHILTKKKTNEFYQNVKEVLKDIDDEVIMKTAGNKRVNFYLLRLKYNKLDRKIEYRQFENRIHVLNNEKMIFNASDTKIKILLMEYTNNNLLITATYPFPFDEEEVRIYADYFGEKIYAKKNNLYSQYKAFGEELYQNYVFDLVIPLKSNMHKQYIKFYLESDKSNVSLDLNFNKPLSRLNGLKYSYWNCGKFILNYRERSILITDNSKPELLKRKIMYIISLLNSKNKNAKKAGIMRIVYYITKPFYKKEIWLFEDKIYKGGDNGEYLYTYASKQKDGIKKYYILKRGCIDAKRFKKEHKKYVKFGSLKHKLLFLNSNIVFQTHNNVTKQHGFDEKMEKYFRDLYNSKNVCIQHGLTVQHIPHLTNRINDNLKQFFLASPIEKKNMENKEYAYEGHLDMLKITGSPRYDGLKNNDKKQILITPTWRSYLALPSPGYGQARKYNENFKNSEYFKIYNSIINDKKLINAAKKYGYKIVYLLHPCTSSQINDYDKSEYVELIAATEDMNYEKILTESSLMITDYSGVQFDFAYMYKPIIYFHPEELPPSHDEGEYKYETMALGEITKSKEETIDLTCQYMKESCKIKDKYKNRIDNFFRYNDNNNSKRVYEEIIKHRKG